MMKVLLALPFALILSTQAFAYDFSGADALYAQRSGSLSKIADARAAYSATLAQTSGADKIYAVEQMSRLDYYESLIASPARSKEVALACYDRTNQIADTGAPQYYYWRLVCLSTWAKANGPLSSLNRSKEIVELLEKGLSVDATYEGGGFYRVGAAVYLNLPAINPFGPRGDINKALQYAQNAISSRAYAGAANPDTATGDYFYNVFGFKAEILEKQNNKAAAIQTLKAAITRIDSGDVPVGREPETAAQEMELKALLTRFGG